MSRTATFFGLWNREDPIGFRLGWLLGAALWLFVLAAMVSFNRFDGPGHASAPLNSPVANWCGPAGAWLAYQLFTMFGVGAWVLLATAGLWLGMSASGRPVGQLGVRALGAGLFALVVAGFHALLAPGWSSAPEGAGGLVAIWGVSELSGRFGGLGAALWLVFLGLIGATVAFDVWVALAPKWALSRAGTGVGGLYARVRERLDEQAELRAARAAARVRENDVDDDERMARTPRAAKVKPAKSSKPAKKARPEPEYNEEEDEDDTGVAVLDEDEDSEYEDDAPEAPGAPQVFDPEALRAKMSKLPVRFAAESRRAATVEDLQDLRAQDTEMAEYKFPSLELLEEPEENYSGKLEAYVREQATNLEEALRVYKIDGEVVGIDSGPVITMYEVKLAPGTKVSQLTAISQDLARAMRVVSIRIVGNIEGRDTVGIEAPNIEKEKVRLKELMSVSEKTKNMRLPTFLGKDASGAPLIYDLASMPHMLIAGTTGSGKSVAINAIIMGFLYTKKPSELKMVLVDPKMVEMSQFKDIPHLMCPVVTEMGKAAAILEWAVTKMDERYELLAEAGCRDIDSYNELTWDELKERLNPTNEVEEAKIPRKLPRIVYMIDELADLMMTHKEVESSIVRIAQKARAVGIHLILATQRPQANVVTGLIKSNMPARICFKVSSGMDSRIVMDQKGGEVLLGQGDMLFLSPRSSKVVRAQGTLVEDREIRRVVRFMKEVATPTFERSLMQLRSPGDAAPVNGVDLNAIAADGEGRDWNKVAQEDSLFERAVEIVIESGRGSVSLLQRRLAIGYTRASRLIELMGIAGVIGEHKGSVAREVMISPEEWAAMKAQAAQDAEATKGTLFAPRSPEERPSPKYYDDDVDEDGAGPVMGADDDGDEDFDPSDEAPDADDSAEEEEEEEDDSNVAVAAHRDDPDDDLEEEDEEDEEEEYEEEDEEDEESDDEESEDGEEEWDEDEEGEEEEGDGEEYEEEEEEEDGEEYEGDEEEEDEEYEEEDEDSDEEEEEEEEEEDDEAELEIETPPFMRKKSKS